MTHLDYLNQKYSIRKTAEEKNLFRSYIIDSLQKKGIEAKVERTKDGKNDNIVIGDPTTAKAVFTAHYDTPAQSIFPNIMMPKSRVIFYAYQFVPIIFLLIVSFGFAFLMGGLIIKDERVFYLSFLIAYYGIFFGIMRAFKNKNNFNDNTSGVATVLSIIDKLAPEEFNKVAFILFDNEEKGKKGSKAYFKDHKDEMLDKFLLNFDCVANGENVIFIAQKEAVNSDEYQKLQTSFKDVNGFALEFLTHKQADSNSDHKNFPKGVACVVCKRAKNGLLYTPYIHTKKDIVANNTNIEFLSKNTCIFIQKI